MKNTEENNQKGYSQQLKQSLLIHLGQIPYIFWYPISAIIQFLYSCAFRLYNAVKDYYQDLALTQKRLTKLTRKAVRLVLNNRSDLMGTAWMRQICRIFTGLLQIVSLLTTYAGLNFFLGSISSFASFALAVVIQGTAWSLLNFRGGRKRTGNGTRNFLLAIALLLSTLTSFIGISNVVHSPIQDMKQTYNAYCTAHQEYLDNVVTKTNMFTLADVQDALNKCNAILQRANGVLTALNSARPDPSTLSTRTSSSHIIGYDPQTNAPIQGSIITTSPITNMRLWDNTLQSLHERLYTDIEALSYSDFTLLPDAEEIFNDATQTENPAETNGAYAAFLQCINEYAYLEEEINDIETQKEKAEVLSVNGNVDTVSPTSKVTLKPETFGLGLIDNYKKKEAQKKNLQIKSYEEIIEGIDGNLSSIHQHLSWLPQPLQEPLRILFPNELQYAERIRVSLNEEMDNVFGQLPSEVQNNSNHALNNAYHANHLPSSQLYPFKYLFSIKDSNWGILLFALGLAAIIDLFSLLLSLSLVKRRDSVLYANHHKENTKNREELLEDCYTYICVQEIFAENGQGLKKVHRTADIYPYVAKMIENTMRGFLEKFQLAYLPKEIDSFGYLSGEKIEEFDFAQKNLFQTLRLIQLIHLITPQELRELLASDFYNLPSNKGGANGSDAQSSLPKKFLSQFPDDNIIFLADNRLLMWFNENFSTLLQSAIPNIVSEEDESELPDDPHGPSGPADSRKEKEGELVGAST